jgi:hypothetical protein
MVALRVPEMVALQGFEYGCTSKFQLWQLLDFKVSNMVAL